MEFEVHGESGEPLLLVMGLGGQLTDWPDGFIDELVDRGFQVITPDNRDSGLSTEFNNPPSTVWQLLKAIVFRRPIPHEYTIDDMADDHVGLLDHLGHERVHVVGMSMGGMIAQSLVTRYPERFRSLTSIMSTTGNPRVGQAKLRTLFGMARFRGGAVSEAAEAAVNSFRLISGPGFDEARVREMAAASIERSYRPAGTSRQLAGILSSDDRTAALAGVATPTLVVHGLVDPLVAPSGGMATAKAVPGSRLVMYPDMGHDLPMNRWGDIADEISQTAAVGATV